MGFLNFLDPVFDVIFTPLLQLGPTWFVVIVSTCISLLIVMVYKFTTDQNLMKRLKSEIKELQAELKMLKDDKDKMMEVNKKMMETNMKYMMQSFKSSIFTLIPILLIYTYLNGMIAFDPLMAQEDFTVSLAFEPVAEGQVRVSTPSGLSVEGNANKTISDETIFTFRGDPGEYLIQFETDEGTYDHTVEIKRREQFGYATPTTNIGNDELSTITTNLNKLVVLDLFGWQLGWFGTYIIISIIGSMIFRKVFKVY